MFEYLQYNSCKVVIWHCAGNDEENKVFADGEILVGGGCTVGTRAISLAINFGFNTFDLYGFDTCVTEDGSHAYDFSNPEVEQLKDVIEVDLAGTKFKMAGYRDWETDRKSTRLNSSHRSLSRMPSSA